MTNPNTPREDAVQGLFNTMNTEQQETLTSARGAIDRQAAIIADLQGQLGPALANAVDDETFASFQASVDALKQSSDEAQAAFDQVGVPAQPQPPVAELVAAHRGKRGGKRGK